MPGVLGTLILKYLLKFKGGFMTGILGFSLGILTYNFFNYFIKFFTDEWLPEFFFQSECIPPYISTAIILVSLVLVYCLHGGEEYDPFFRTKRNPIYLKEIR
jgi:hypothetical protein